MQPKDASEGGSLYSILNLAYPYPRFELKTKTTRWCFFGVFLVCFWCVSDKNTKNTQMRAKTDIKTQPHSNFKWVFIPAFLLWCFYINVTGEYYSNSKAGNGLATGSFEKAPSSESHRSSMMIGRTTAAWLKTETRFGAQPAARSKTKIHMIPAQDRRCRSGWGGTFPPA